MPIPLLIPIIISAVVSLGAAITYKYWKKIKIYFKGKNLIILGTIETGKTTLHRYLRYGEIVKDHKATRRTQKVKGRTFKLEELKLKLSKGDDISGQKDFEKIWRDMFITGDICFYLFDSSRVYKGDNFYIETVNNHLKHIGIWKNDNKDIQVVVIGTFADKIPIYDELDESSIQKLDEILRGKIRLTNGKISASEFFIGNLSNENDMKLLISEILSYLLK